MEDRCGVYPFMLKGQMKFWDKERDDRSQAEGGEEHAAAAWRHVDVTCLGIAVHCNAGIVCYGPTAASLSCLV
jgi:hypothetical protein